MKSCIPIRFFVLACSCACVLCCRVSVRVPKFEILENAAAESVKNAVQVMGEQMTRFTEESTKHLQTMGSSFTQFLEEMSGSVERGIVTVVGQVEGMREDLNKYFTEISKTVKKLEEAVTPRIIAILDDVDIAVRRSHILIDVGIVLFLLLVIFVSDCLRLKMSTGNDLISCCGYIIMSFLELSFLVCAVAVMVNIFYKVIMGKDIEKDLLLQFIVFFIVSIILFFVVLPLAWKIVKTILLISVWPLQTNISAWLRVGLFSLFTIVISVFFYYSTSPIVSLIVSCVLFLGVGICVNVVTYFFASKSTNEDEVRRFRRLYFEGMPTIKYKQPRKLLYRKF